MNKQESLEIIKKEGLHGYNLEGKDIKANEVGIQYENSLWKLYTTDEKANCRVIKEYNSEGDAIRHLIECLRINKKFEERRKKRNPRLQ